MYAYSFEGVSVTTVILAPGACGVWTGAPSRTSCHHFTIIRRSGGPRGCVPDG